MVKDSKAMSLEEQIEFYKKELAKLAKGHTAQPVAEKRKELGQKALAFDAESAGRKGPERPNPTKTAVKEQADIQEKGETPAFSTSVEKAKKTTAITLELPAADTEPLRSKPTEKKLPACGKTRRTMEEEVSEFLEANPYKGWLRVQTYLGVKTVPVPDAKVVVYRNFESGQHVFSEAVTDQSGQTQELQLPAPPRELSLRPGTETPYAQYSVNVTCPGFCNYNTNNVIIFPDVGSILPVVMHTEDCNGGV